MQDADLSHSQHAQTTFPTERGVLPQDLEISTSLPVGYDESQTSVGSQTSNPEISAASSHHYGYHTVPSQNGMSWYSKSQHSAHFTSSQPGALDGPHMPDHGLAAQRPAIQQSRTITPGIPSAVAANFPNRMNMGTFETAETVDQAWDHSWMTFLRDSGLG